MAASIKNKCFGINKLVFILIAVPYLIMIIPITFLNIIVFWTPIYLARKVVEQCRRVVWKIVKYKTVSVIANLAGSAVFFLLYILEITTKIKWQTLDIGVRN
jgi:hypothetical protein